MDGIQWAVSAMSAARARLDAATQNITGAASDAFRKVRVRGRLSASGVTMTRTRDGAQGALRRTGRDLDLAIAGRGVFTLRKPDGTLAHTRDGAFERDRFGHITDTQGRVLMGEHGPITLTPDAKVDAAFLAQIPLPNGSRVRSGFLESSNVDAIGEMVDLIAAQRSFETASKVLTAIDGTREKETAQVGLVRS